MQRLQNYQTRELNLHPTDLHCDDAPVTLHGLPALLLWNHPEGKNMHSHSSHSVYSLAHADKHMWQGRFSQWTQKKARWRNTKDGTTDGRNNSQSNQQSVKCCNEKVTNDRIEPASDGFVLRRCCRCIRLVSSLIGAEQHQKIRTHSHCTLPYVATCSPMETNTCGRATLFSMNTSEDD